jgi:hypothetical protein
MAAENYLKLTCQLLTLTLQENPKKSIDFAWKTSLDAKKKPSPVFKIKSGKVSSNSHLLLLSIAAATISASAGTAFSAEANAMEGEIRRTGALKNAIACFEKALELFCLSQQIFHKSEVNILCPEMNLNASISFALLSVAHQRMAKFRILFLEKDETKSSELIYLAQSIQEKLGMAR